MNSSSDRSVYTEAAINVPRNQKTTTDIVVFADDYAI
jgi:hypothetical protein